MKFKKCNWQNEERCLQSDLLFLLETLDDSLELGNWRSISYSWESLLTISNRNVLLLSVWSLSVSIERPYWDLKVYHKFLLKIAFSKYEKFIVHNLKFSSRFATSACELRLTVFEALKETGKLSRHSPVPCGGWNQAAWCTWWVSVVDRRPASWSHSIRHPDSRIPGHLKSLRSPLPKFDFTEVESAES